MHMKTPMHKPTDIQGQNQPRNSPSPYSSPGAQSQENNRQLRDLLQQQPQQNSANTFRQPLPPGMIQRPQRFMGPQQHQTIKSVVTVQNTQIASSQVDGTAPPNVGPQVPPSVQSNNNMVNTSTSEQQPCAPTQSAAEQSQINDNFNHSDLEKLEEVGDLLFGEDDEDELLKSFTNADCFNILDFTDPELNALDDVDQANILDTFDLDDTEVKEKSKRDTLEKLNKAHENKAAAIIQLKTSQSAEQTANTSNQIVSNLTQAVLPNQLAQHARQPPTQQQIMMQQRYETVNQRKKDRVRL